jgi:hypothetical protein
MRRIDATHRRQLDVAFSWKGERMHCHFRSERSRCSHASLRRAKQADTADSHCAPRLGRSK